MYTVKVRKLSKQVKNAPEAKFIAHLVHTFEDGSSLKSGAWFGTDKSELTNRVLKQSGLL